MPNLESKAGIFSILLLSAGNVTGMIISALALIIYSRYLGPTEFGVFSVAFAFMQIVIRLADFGTNMAAEREIARAYDNVTSRTSLIQTTLYLKAATYGLVFLVLYFLSPWITFTLLKIEDLSLIRAAILLAGGTVVFEYATLVFQASHHFDLVARMTIAQGVGKLIFSGILMWQGMLTSLLGLMIYGIMPAIGAFIAFAKSPLHSLSLPQDWKKQLSQILAIAKWTCISAFALTVADNLDILMVQAMMSSYEAGIWSGAVRIGTFANLIGWSVGSVLNIRVARYRDKKHLSSYLHKAWKMALAVFGVVLLSLPLASLAIKYSIGSSYLVATIPLQILLISIAISAATVPYIALFYVFDSPQYYAISGLLQIALLVIGDYYLIPLFGLSGSAWVRVGVRLVILIFTLFYAHLSYRKHFKVKNLFAES